jgi:AraC-like DNA-binding protein
LRNTNRSITEISLDVGFRSLGSFSTGFRALTGESPSDYARRWHATATPAIPGCFTLMHTRPVRSSSSREADARDQG